MRLRARLFLLTVSTLTFACGPKQEPSLCDQTPAPAQCAATCDSTLGAPNTCSAGYHCSTSGTCDASCTQGGTECGTDGHCTADGFCESNGGGTDDPGPDAACPAVHFTATAITPSILLLIDQSGSMDDDFQNGQNGESKYKAVDDALVGSNGVVTRLQDKAIFGATLYTTNGNTCPALKKAPRAISNLSMVKTLIEGNKPGKNTPTPEAINAAVADFVTTPPPAASPPIIVLATDGIPNKCDSNTPTTTESVAAAKASFDAGIRLFILSVGDGVTESHAQAMANAGAGVTAGQPNAPFFKGSDPATLAAAFQQIIGGVLSCDLTIDGSIDESTAMSGTVTLDGSPLVYGTDWKLAAPTTIELVGTACDTLKNATNPVVDASFPCGTVIQ